MLGIEEDDTMIQHEKVMLRPEDTNMGRYAYYVILNQRARHDDRHAAEMRIICTATHSYDDDMAMNDWQRIIFPDNTII